MLIWLFRVEGLQASKAEHQVEILSAFGRVSIHYVTLQGLYFSFIPANQNGAPQL
jgi:hypothetical protein